MASTSKRACPDGAPAGHAAVAGEDPSANAPSLVLRATESSLMGEGEKLIASAVKAARKAGQAEHSKNSMAQLQSTGETLAALGRAPLQVQTTSTPVNAQAQARVDALHEQFTAQVMAIVVDAHKQAADDQQEAAREAATEAEQLFEAAAQHALGMAPPPELRRTVALVSDWFKKRLQSQMTAAHQAAARAQAPAPPAPPQPDAAMPAADAAPSNQQQELLAVLQALQANSQRVDQRLERLEGQRLPPQQPGSRSRAAAAPRVQHSNW